MATQTSTEVLKERIRLLEIRQAEQGEKLKEQFKATAESLKPVNLIKSSLKEFSTSKEIVGTVIESATLLLTGFASKRLIDSSKGGSFVKLLTSLFQLVGSGLLNVYSVKIQEFIAGLILKFSKEPGPETPE
jgi:hypothetical protein